MLSLSIHPDGSAGDLSSVRIGVWGYAGNGAIDASDFGHVRAPADSGFVPLGGYDLTGTGELSVDVTAFLQGMATGGSTWAGFMVWMDPASLPLRSTLSGDTTFTASISSRESGSWAQLDVTPVPEPASLLLFGTGIAGLALKRHGRKQL